MKTKKAPARKKSDKEIGRLLIKVGVVCYIVLIYLVCHVEKIGFTDPDTFLGDVLQRVITQPFAITPINWTWIGVTSFLYFLLAASVQIAYEKQMNTRPGEESGSAKWNDDYDKFAAKYAEPFGKKENVKKTGWIEKDTGLPWKRQRKRLGQEEEEEKKTTSFAVAIKNLMKRKLERWKAELKDRWLDFKSQFYKENRAEPDKPYRDPTPRERKRYEKICELERKLDMNLDRKKPKACLEERKRIAEEERKKALEGERIYEMRRRRLTQERKPTQKYTATLVPVNRNMLLSQNVALSMDGRKTRKNCNTLILGGSGAGKTRFYLKPNLMQLNCSYVITDPSGEILQTHGKFLENAGYEIKVINLTNMDQSHCYNPFNYVREDADILVMIDVLTKNLTPPDSHSSDPFWPKSQAALLQAICFYLYKECRPSERNFTNVMKLLRAAIIKDDGSDYKSPLDIIFEDLEKKDPNHIAVMQYSIFKQAPAKTASTILTCAQVDLAPFNLDTIANLTGRDTLDMGSIGLRPTALFCITPTAKTTYNWIISLAYTQLFETLYYIAETQCKGLRLPVHVRFLLDEFARKSVLLNVA